jgi:hypothetical protein
MIEKENDLSLNDAADEPQPAKRPVSLGIGLTFAVLGLLTPLLVYAAVWFIIPHPPEGQRGTPGDGLGIMLIAIIGIIWWTNSEIISLISVVVGIVRKESGRIKIFAIATSALSLILIVLVYAGAYMFVKHVENETKRYEATRKL